MMWRSFSSIRFWHLLPVSIILYIIYTSTVTKFFSENSIIDEDFDVIGALKVAESFQKIKRNSTNYYKPWWETGDCILDQSRGWIPRQDSLNEVKRPPTTIGTCSESVSNEGPHQKIISFSLFGSDKGYWRGLNETLTKVKSFYPGWKVWIYTTPKNLSSILCPLLIEHDHLRVCDVSNMPYPLHDISEVAPTMWRISPLGDPAVDILVMRDSDMKFTKRDQSAVMDWLSTGKPFHLMRDHPNHLAHILAGMWGARWNIASKPQYIITSSSLLKPPSSEDLLKLRNKMLLKAYKRNDPGLDQEILRTIMWPEMIGLLVTHDSYLCKKFPPGWRPWPTQRVNGSFVGNAQYREEYSQSIMKKDCPPECRPSDHPDWLSC